MCVQTKSTIKNIIFISFVILVINSCIDVIPIPSDLDTSKLFLVCEMKVGEKITADVQFSGDTNGRLPATILNGDSLRFSIAEGDNDWGVNFKYDSILKNYYINQSEFEIKPGVQYKLRGIGTGLNDRLEPNISVPNSISLDDFKIVSSSVTEKNGTFTTELRCIMKIQSPSLLPAYFWIIPRTETGTLWKLDKIEQNASAYKKLSHRNGFLVDYSRLNSNELFFCLSVSEKVKTSHVHVELNNVCNAFYRYNVYASNVNASNNTTTLNPAIAGFNIVTEKGYGSFSSLNGTEWAFKIR